MMCSVATLFFRCLYMAVLLSPFLEVTGVMTLSCDGQSGFYPHPSSCFHFIACAHGQPFIMACPGGLHFNSVLKLCDWPTSSGCNLPPTTVVTPSPLPCSTLCPSHVGYFQFPDWSNCTRYYICMRGAVSGPVSCPDGLFYDFLRWTCAFKQDVTCYTE